MFERFRRYDVQANWALGLALIAALPCALAVWMALRNYDATLGQIVYGSRGRFVIYFVGCVLISMLPGAMGFFLGLSSAGQRRNERPAAAWIGFFLGGFVVTLNLILLAAFFMLRLESPM